MTDPSNLDFHDMIEVEINCSICGNYMGHIIVKKEAATDNQIIDSLNVLTKSSAVDIVWPTCWITKVEKRNFYRIELIISLLLWPCLSFM
jgi:hypothetical protein